MQILVTGGAGFIGAHFIEYILKKYPEYKIINLDALTYAGDLEKISHLEDNHNYRFVRGDVCEIKTIERLLEEGVDVAINFAAETHVDRSILDSGSFLTTNIYGAYVILELLKSYGIKRYLQISTDEVYGAVKKEAFDEESALKPNNPYAATKASADLLARAYHKSYDLPLIVIRGSNNFGPYQYPEKMMPLFITNAIENQKIPLYGDGLYVRDWLYVEDFCRAIDLVLHQGKEGEIYNVASGVEKTNLEVLLKIMDLVGRSEDLIKKAPDRPSHDKRYSLNCQKIKQLGFEPQNQFDEYLTETVKWYQNNQNWWQSIKNSPAYTEFYHTWYQS